MKNLKNKVTKKEILFKLFIAATEQFLKKKGENQMYFDEKRTKILSPDVKLILDENKHI